MKWKKIIADALEKLAQTTDATATSLKMELLRALEDKELKWKIFKKWIIAAVVQLMIQIATILFGFL